MFYVISGYCGPDNHTSDDGPLLEIAEYKTVDEVEAAYAEFLEDIGGDDDDGENSQITFRVIEGVERKMVAEETVVKHKLR